MHISTRWIFPDVAGLAICVYEINGGYGILPRILYYVLYLALVIAGHDELIQQLALIYVMLYSACASIHAFVLVAILMNNEALAIDLDLLAIWPILAIGAITVAPIIEWLKVVRKSNGTFIIICWGLLEWAGAVLILIGVWMLRSKPGEALCKAPDGTILEDPKQLIYQPEKFNCAYASFKKDSWIRTASEARILKDFAANGYPTHLTGFDYTFMWLAVTVLVQPLQMGYTWWLHVHNKTSLSEWKRLCVLHRQSPRSPMTMLFLVFYSVMILLAFHNFVVFLATTVVVELYIHQAGFQANDTLVGPSEWSGWVYIGLTLAGWGLNSAYSKYAGRKIKLDDEETQVQEPDQSEMGEVRRRATFP